MTVPMAPVRATAPIRRIPLALLGTSVALIALVMLGARDGVLAAGCYLGVSLIVLEGAIRAIRAVRSRLILPVLATVLAVVAVTTLSVTVAAALSDPYGWVTAFAIAGGVLVYSGLQASSTATPWQSLSSGAAFRQPAALMVLSGIVVLLFAAYLAVVSWESLRMIYPMRSVALAVVVAAAFGAAGVVMVVRAIRPSASPATTRHDAEVAAHLHDSVLQTLALIGRSADDPARVQQLARQQERSLRAWLAGRDEAAATSLTGAIRVAAQEVEDEVTGARIEVVAVGDAPLDRLSDALVRAAREAMRNAARHAGSPVRVFVEVEGSVREVFIRDTGSGFELAEIADERRGVRDAIIGRMEHVGGSATIDSGAGGTEIALRVDDPAS